MLKVTRTVLPLFLFYLLFFATDLYGQGWNGIVPLKTTQRQVDKIMGKSRLPNRYSVVYKTEDFKIAILFSRGDCKRRVKGEAVWNVQKGVVTMIQLTPQKHLPLSESQWKDTEYLKEKYPGLDQSFSYFAPDETVSIITQLFPDDGVEFIRSIDITPGKAGKKYLCR